MNVTVTDDKEKQIEFAEKVIRERKEIYKINVINQVTEIIAFQKPLLTDGQRKEYLLVSIYDYWVYGCNTLEWCIYNFYDKKHHEKLEYVTWKLRYQYVKQLNELKDAELFDNKWKTYNLLKKYYKRDIILIAENEDYHSFLKFQKRHPIFVVKSANTDMVIKPYKVDTDAMSEQEIKNVFDQIIMNGKMVEEKYKGPNRGIVNQMICEEEIIQTEETAVFHPASVNSIRATLVRVNGKNTIFKPWIKMGRNNDFLTWERTGSLSAGIDAKSGIIESAGVDNFGNSYNKHPDTGVQILGAQIPRWDELLKFVDDLSKQLPNIHYMGWDLVLTSQGWCVMEGNFWGDHYWQTHYQRGFRREFENLISWKMDKDFWWQ